MSKESFKTFEDLECWKACTEVRRFITELVKKYPKEERFSLVDDMKRAARPTSHNIAEGFGCYHLGIIEDRFSMTLLLTYLSSFMTWWER